MVNKLAAATLGAGCFWCVEAIFQRLKGVEKVVSGYAGGRIPNPSYERVCTGATGHAEVVQITFDPNIISFEDLLHVFLHTHDPTTLNRQGADAGTQYRSVIFYHDEKQQEIAQHVITEVGAAGLFPNPIVTEILPFTNFYRAEAEHQNFYLSNSNQPYCRMVIDPKIRKFQRDFDHKVVETD